MAKFTIKTVIDKPLEIVFQAFTDPDNMLLWTKDLERIEIVKGKLGELGATMKLYYNQKGRIHVMHDELLDFEAEKMIKSKVTGDGITVLVSTEFRHQPAATEIVMHWDGKGSNFLVSLIIRLNIRNISRQAQAELARFKALVEQDGVKFR